MKCRPHGPCYPCSCSQLNCMLHSNSLALSLHHMHMSNSLEDLQQICVNYKSMARWSVRECLSPSTDTCIHACTDRQPENTMYKICNMNDILIKLKNVARPMLQTLEAPIFDSIVHKLKHTITKLTNRIAEVYTSSNLRLRKIFKVEDWKYC